MNANPTEIWLTESMRTATTDVLAPEGLETTSLVAGLRRRRRRQVLQGLGLVAAVVAVGALVASEGVLRNDGGSTTDALATSETLADLYMVTPNQEHVVAVPTVITSSGDTGLDALRALMTEQPDDVSLRNGFNYMTDQPFAVVNTVVSTEELIIVDLSGVTTEPAGLLRPSGVLWDPYPTIDCDCISGEVIMQQLVWTVQSALRSDAPVLLLEDGKPAKGLWLYELGGPTDADPQIEVPADNTGVTE